MSQSQNKSGHPEPTVVQGEEKLLSDPDKWVDNHGNYLYRFALLRIHDSQLAEDMVQETFLAALKSKGGFEGRSSERTWLTGILKNKIIDYYRKNARVTGFSNTFGAGDVADFVTTGKAKGHWKSGSAPSDWGKNPQRLLENKEFNKVMERCLGYLPRHLAAVFSAREIEGWKSDEICKEFSFSTSNLWVMLHRARTQLRRCLDVNWFNPSPEKG